MHRSARDLGPNDLILSTFSIPAGVGPVERVEAAGQAGFAGIGWYVGMVERWLAEGWTIPDLRSLLRENGVVLAELEAIFDGQGEASRRDRPELATLLQALLGN